MGRKVINKKPENITNIGGQALIEGVMMKGTKNISIAVRKPDGDIVVKNEELDGITSKIKFFKLPFLRGVIAFLEAMIIGVKSLMYSASFYEEDDSELGVIDKFLYKLFKDKTEDVVMYLSLGVSMIVAIGLFMLGPSFLTNFLKGKIDNNILLNLLEGIIRVGMFIIYVLSISKLEDVVRVFQYHGAEHKTIHCYENGEDLTVLNVKKHSILHPRCGTSFIFMVMIISIFVFSFFGWPSPIKRLILRIILLPVIAGISYEINKIIGKSAGIFSYIVSYPGLMLQRYATVKEPDDDQIEVAIKALNGVLGIDEEESFW